MRGAGGFLSRNGGGYAVLRCGSLPTETVSKRALDWRRYGNLRRAIPGFTFLQQDAAGRFEPGRAWGAEGGLFWRLSLAESLPNGMISSGKRSELSAPSSTHFLDAGVCGFTKHDWLEALLFAVAVAVGLTPEMLPMIVTVNPAKGAIAMSKKRVIVKRLGTPAIRAVRVRMMICSPSPFLAGCSPPCVVAPNIRSRRTPLNSAATSYTYRKFSTINAVASKVVSLKGLRLLCFV